MTKSEDDVRPHPELYTTPTMQAALAPPPDLNTLPGVDFDQAEIDVGRREFLSALINSDVILSQFDESFLANNLHSQYFSFRQRSYIDTLAIKYAHVY